MTRFCDQVLRSDMWSCFVVSLNLEVSPESDVSAPLLDHAKLPLPTASLPLFHFEPFQRAVHTGSKHESFRGSGFSGNNWGGGINVHRVVESHGRFPHL